MSFLTWITHFCSRDRWHPCVSQRDRKKDVGIDLYVICMYSAIL